MHSEDRMEVKAPQVSLECQARRVIQDQREILGQQDQLDNLVFQERADHLVPLVTLEQQDSPDHKDFLEQAVLQEPQDQLEPQELLDLLV